MSDQESRPQAPRRKKLVLRRIAANGSSPSEAWSNSYTGPLPPVRPPPNRQTARLGADGPDDAAQEIISEQSFERIEAIERIDHVERAPMSAAPRPEAWAAAAMTPPAPRSTEVATSLAARTPPDRALSAPSSRATGGATGGTSRISVPPVVAPLPAPAAIAPHLDFGRARFSIDSKVLVGGGALAASMLLVAFGVFLGVHSTRPAANSTTAGVPATVVIDPKGPASPVLAPEGVADRPPNGASEPAEPSEQRAMDSTRNRVEVVDPTLTVDVSQLPPAVANAGRTPFASIPKSSKPSTGWSVATGSAVRPLEVPNEASNAVNLPTPSPGTAADSPSNGASASAGLEAPRSPTIAVDPLVQAVREDIREDEARSATSRSR